MPIPPDLSMPQLIGFGFTLIMSLIINSISAASLAEVIIPNIIGKG